MLVMVVILPLSQSIDDGEVLNNAGGGGSGGGGGGDGGGGL